DVVVAETAGLVDGELDDSLRAWGEPDLTDDGPIAASDDELDRRPHLGQLDVHVLEDASRDAFAFTDQAEEQVLRADVVVVEPLGLILGQRQDLAGPIRELVEPLHGVERPFPFCTVAGAVAMLARTNFAETPPGSPAVTAS